MTKSLEQKIQEVLKKHKKPGEAPTRVWNDELKVSQYYTTYIEWLKQTHGAK